MSPTEELQALRQECEQLREKVRELQSALKLNDPSIQTTFRLTPAVADIFGLLMAVQRVTPEMVSQRLGLASDPKVAMHRVRKAVKPFGIEVESKRHIGYWLDPETKHRVNQMLEGVSLSEPSDDAQAGSAAA